MESALYYTFSTIAQTLAAAVALVSAFALYRLQSMNAEIAERSSTVAQFSSGAHAPAVRELHVHGRFHEVLESTEDFDPSATVELNYQVSAARVRLGTLLAQRRALRRYLSLAFWLSGGLLTSSLVAIASAPRIATVPHAAVAALSLGILWFVLCIATYARLIWGALA
jgi:hypothetical protein